MQCCQLRVSRLLGSRVRNMEYSCIWILECEMWGRQVRMRHEIGWRKISCGIVSPSGSTLGEFWHLLESLINWWWWKKYLTEITAWVRCSIISLFTWHCLRTWGTCSISVGTAPWNNETGVQEWTDLLYSKQIGDSLQSDKINKQTWVSQHIYLHTHSRCNIQWLIIVTNQEHYQA